MIKLGKPEYAQYHTKNSSFERRQSATLKQEFEMHFITFEQENFEKHKILILKTLQYLSTMNVSSLKNDTTRQECL